MSSAEYINSIVKIKKIKAPLSNLTVVQEVSPVRSDPDNEGNKPVVMQPPLTLEILTYDNTKDVTFTDINGTDYTLKTAATARVTDANGNVYDIDTITHA